MNSSVLGDIITLKGGVCLRRSPYLEYLKQQREDEKIEIKRKKQFRHDWRIAIFSTLGGAAAGLITSIIFLATNQQIREPKIAPHIAPKIPKAYRATLYQYKYISL